jgi:hypothetical protein
VIIAAASVPLVLLIGALAVLMLPELIPPFLRSRRRSTVTRGALRVLIPAGLVICAVLIGILALSGPRKPREPVAAPPPHRVLPTPPRNQPDEFPWWTVLVAAGAIAAAGAAVRMRARRRRPGLESFRHARGAGAATAAGLEPLPSDPRAAVLAAYARMERALAASGVGRDRGEAPWPYSERVGAERPGDAQPVAELTGLVETAAFSPHPVGTGERGRAAAALGAVEEER